MALRWLDLDAVPRVIIGDDHTLFWMNGAAREDLARRCDIEARNGMLVATDAARQPALARFLEGAGEVLSTFSMPCDDGDGHLILHCRQLRFIGAFRALGLSFFRSGSRFEAGYANLREAFQLTGAEERVLASMLEGATAEIVSEKLGVSIETTRTHLRHIYAKLNVRSREELFSRVRPFRV